MRLGDKIGLREEVIQKACRLAMKAHDRAPSKPYLFDKSRGCSEAIFAFPGSWGVEDWYTKQPFGEVKVDLSKFGCVKSVGNEEIGLVNEAFCRRFDELLSRSSLVIEVEKTISDKRQPVFTGHSSGGAIAILTTIWFFEKYVRPNHSSTRPFCLTFGSPLVGNHVLSHALRRENWAQNFVHFITKHDIVPRITLAPLPHIEPWLHHILASLNPKSPHHGPPNPRVASDFLLSVMRNALSVASHIACYLKGCTNLLLENVASIVELSPYRPFGIVVFCTGNGKLVVVENPDAVLEMMFYCLQLSPIW